MQDRLSPVRYAHNCAMRALRAFFTHFTQLDAGIQRVAIWCP